jgi:hypothetical protein
MEGEAMVRMEIVLQRAPDDPKVHDPKFQSELRDFSKALRAAGIEYSQGGMAFDAADGGGFPLPEFLVVLTAAITPLAGLCGAWLQARYGRKVRVKIGDVEAEGRTVEEVDELLKRAVKFRETNDASIGKD